MVKSSMRKLQVIWFFVVAFAVIIWNVIKGHEWHMAYFDFHLGDDDKGRPIRKQLIAKKRCESFEIYWQDLNAFKDDA